MNWLSQWFASHKLSAHITLASILSLFGTLFGLYTNVPAFQTWCQHVYSGLPGWAAMTVSMVVMVLMWYWKTSEPAKVYSGETGTTTTIAPGTTVVVPSITATGQSAK